MADEDDEVTEYVRKLEERAGRRARCREASGDAIAQEFERYLRRRQPPRSGGTGG